MKNTPDRKRPLDAEQIADLAEKGEDVSHFSTGNGRMTAPAQRVNVDFAAPMLGELDDAAKNLNISRQALIKTLIRQALDYHYMARNAAKTSRAK